MALNEYVEIHPVNASSHFIDGHGKYVLCQLRLFKGILHAENY